MAAVDIPIVQVSIRNFISYTAQQVTNWMTRKLLAVPKTAGSVSTKYALNYDVTQIAIAMYKLGQN